MKCLYSTIYLKGTPPPDILRKCAVSITKCAETDAIVVDDILETVEANKTYIVRQKSPIAGFSEYLVIDDRKPETTNKAAAAAASIPNIHVFANDDSFIDEAFVLREYLAGRTVGIVKFDELENGQLVEHIPKVKK